MFRRRRFRRAGPPPLRAAFLSALAEANRLLAEGQAQQAMLRFATLAQKLAENDLPRKSANLYARAAHAAVAAGDAAMALAYARSALSIFTQYGMVRRIPVFYANIIQAMRSRDMQAAIDRLRSEYEAQVSQLPAPPLQEPSVSRGHLPDTCPHCGAPARSDEVDWIDNSSAECIYCGGVVQAGQA